MKFRKSLINDIASGFLFIVGVVCAASGVGLSHWQMFGVGVIAIQLSISLDLSNIKRGLWG